MAVSNAFPPKFIEQVVDFPDEGSFELSQPLTDYRICHDGEPLEARILFTCKRLESGEEYIIKVKVQVPDNSGAEPEAGPSTTTRAELEALEKFSKANSPYAPQLVTWKCAVQGDDGPLPGGYISYAVMTKVKGETLFDLKYLSMGMEEREEIIREFVPALRSVYALGIEPIDRALRNVLWDRETKKCGIIDFELWRETKDMYANETTELQRWGLVKRPKPKDFFEIWNYQAR